MKKLFTLSSILFFIIFNLQAQYIVDYTYLEDIACNGDSTKLVDNSILPTWDNIKSYEWKINNAPYVYGSSVLITYLPAGTHTIGLRIKTDLDTVKSVFKQVHVSDIAAEFTAEHLCQNEQSNFYNKSYTLNCTIDKYFWTFDNDPFIATNENPTYVFETDGVHTVTLEVITTNGCKSTITKNITVNSIPQITLTFDPPDTLIWKGQELTVTLIEPYSTILWSTGSNANQIIITESGYYAVEVEDGGCSNTQGFDVLVKENSNILKPMTLITPNADGYNDKWIIKPVILPGEKIEVLIYNRYGDEVYSHSNYDNDWQGTYKGEKLPEGTYYYIVIDQNGNEFKGPINIIY